MNDPNAGQGIAVSARRFACVLAVVLFFSTIGVGIVPGREAGSQGMAPQVASRPAEAETPAGQDLVDEDGHRENLLSTTTRHKTH